jgi:hypothetical protein
VTCVWGRFFFIKIMKKKLIENLGNKSLKQSIKRMGEEEYGSHIYA